MGSAFRRTVPPSGGPSPPSGPTIVRFYGGAGVDTRGRSLDDILAWDDDALERVHDFIQWLFPLDEPSAFNPDAPLLADDDRTAFRGDAHLAANLKRAFLRILTFYGFALDEAGGAPVVRRSSSWEVRRSVWLHPGNHNHLRLTRILKSLVLLGQPALARALLERLQEEAKTAGPGCISPTTLRYWSEAVR